MSYPSPTTIKKLSMLSRNICAFPKCQLSLVDEESNTITAQICHIKAKNAGGPRYDTTQTNEQRDAFENLVLMCPLHHKIIDDDEISYTVERLQEIKKNHESQTSSDFEQSDLEKLLENYLRGLIEKGIVQNKSPELKEVNSALMKAQKLAKEKEHEQRRSDWLHSTNGLKDALSSINEISSLIDRHFTENLTTYQTLGVEIFKKKGFRSIFTRKFHSQIELKGFQEHQFSYNKAANLYFDLGVYKKRPAHFESGFYHDNISRLSLSADLNIDGQVIWKDKKNPKIEFTAEGVCEKLFDLLMTELNTKQTDEYEFEQTNYDSDEDEYGYGFEPL